MKKWYLRSIDVFWKCIVAENAPQQKSGSTNCGYYVALAIKNLIFSGEHDERYVLPRSRIRKLLAQEILGKKLFF